MADEPDEKQHDETPGNRSRVPGGRVNDTEEDDKGLEVGNAVWKTKLSYRTIRDVLALVREVLQSPAVAPYLKYPIIAFAIAIIILTTCWGIQWVTK